jgi:hypothetical protein
MRATKCSSEHWASRLSSPFPRSRWDVSTFGGLAKREAAESAQPLTAFPQIWGVSARWPSCLDGAVRYHGAAASVALALPL